MDAAPTKYAGSGKTVPKAVQDYLNDKNTPMLAHLGTIAANATWGETEILARSTQMLSSVWTTLYGSWLV
jgi:hypothetical protein